MGYFIEPERRTGNAEIHPMLKAALRFFIDTFKGRAFVSSGEMTEALAVRIADPNSEFHSKSAEEWIPYFDAAPETARDRAMLTPNRERTARRKFELSQKINDNAKLLGGLVHYLSYLVAGEWVALKQPRREGSRKLTSDYLRHLTAARRVLRLRARKRFSPDGSSHCEYYLSPFYEAQLYATTGLNLSDACTRADFHSLPCGFKLRDLREFSDEHPDLLERTKAFLAQDYLQENNLPTMPLRPIHSGRMTEIEYEQHRREAWFNRTFPGLDL